MSAPDRWVVQAEDESGDWYQVGLLYDDARIAKLRAESFARDFKGKRRFRVVRATPATVTREEG